jgi:hypothetical protein
MKELRAKRLKEQGEAEAEGDPENQPVIPQTSAVTPKKEGSMEDLSDLDEMLDGQEQYFDQLADEIEFSEEDEEEEGSLTIKNASKYLSYKP